MTLVFKNESGPAALFIAEQLEYYDETSLDAEAAQEIRRLYSENQRLQEELVHEARRTAEQKLRADQMTRQHADQSRMASQARAELSELRRQKGTP